MSTGGDALPDQVAAGAVPEETANYIGLTEASLTATARWVSVSIAYDTRRRAGYEDPTPPNRLDRPVRPSVHPNAATAAARYYSPGLLHKNFLIPRPYL
jgi:hypothetical protein